MLGTKYLRREHWSQFLVHWRNEASLCNIAHGSERAGEFFHGTQKVFLDSKVLIHSHKRLCFLLDSTGGAGKRDKILDPDRQFQSCFHTLLFAIRPSDSEFLSLWLHAIQCRSPTHQPALHEQCYWSVAKNRKLFKNQIRFNET